MAACFHFLNPFRSGSANGTSIPVSADAPPRPRLGIALSSGGAKGLAHVGVIQVLEENDIPIDAIVGTSMGAYVGGLWASGLSGAELEELAASMAGRRELWELVDPALPRRGFIGGRKVLQRLRRTLGEKTFSELRTPFYCVATELNGYARAVLHEGDVATAILASLAIPGIVAPIVRDGIEYIDGGVCDPLPVGVLRELPGIDKVIAVNVLPTVTQTGSFREAAPEYRIWKNPCAFLNQYLNLFARGNLLDILRGAAMGSQMRLVEGSASHADVLIPAISPVPRWHDYNNYRDYIALGRASAEGMLPQLRALLEASEKAEQKTPDIITSLKKVACV